jgi:hypothetical protein
MEIIMDEYKGRKIFERDGRVYVEGECFDAAGYTSIAEARTAIDVDDFENMIAQGHVEVLSERLTGE